MKTKIVYVVISDISDIYLEQALLSVYSLRIYMPDIEVILLIDDLTNNTLKGKRAKILDYITEKVVITLENKYTNQQRSRYLKTSMRNYIDGDFLFIDTDTIITSPLDGVDSFNCDIGAVEELHITQLKAQPDYLRIQKNFARIGAKIGECDTYFNSGVIYVRDNEKTREFFKVWNKNWAKGISKGVNLDQPSFAISNRLNDNLIQNLPGVWNCQIYWGLKYLYNSKIIHYFSSNIPYLKGVLSDYTSKDLYLRIKEKGYIDEKIDFIVKNPFNNFSKNTRIIFGTDVYFWDSYLVRLLRFLNMNYKKVYKTMDSVIKFVFSRN